MTKPIHNQPATLFAVLDDCLLKDRFSFIKRINGAKRILDKKKQQAALDTIAQAMAISIQTRQMRASTPLKIEYPAQLPVSQKRDEILRALSENQVIIVAGETGSGKTTQLPKICLELGLGIKGLIGHTQPRRIAARAVANRLCEELGCEIGQAVGYQVRFSDHSTPQSRVKLMTDGILLAEIAHDKYLNKYDCIIIDEAHERSLNIDFILGYLKQLLPKRPDLKVIITSATIDPQRFSSHFDNAPIITVSGRTYPVEVRYRPIINEENDGDRDLQQAIFDAVDELLHEAPGDILIFMSGEREIRDLAQALNKRELRDTQILPLYARLAAHEQNRVFQSHIGRRIVLATNVAETSLTVPGIKYVIDPGLARISRYSHRTKVQRLPIEPISQASADQRKGRCGRVSDGICIRLYSQEDFANRSEFTDPEIARTNLASVILHMLWLGLGEISTFPFVEAPDSRHINDGVKLLEELGAVKQIGTSRPQLTEIGKVLAQLPIDPRLARMVFEANKQGALAETMVIVAALSIQDPRERPNDKQQAADEKHRRFADQHSDFATFLNLWRYLKEQQKAQSSNQFRQLCKKEYLNYLRVREWQDLHSQIRQVVQELGYSIN
ncbi:MAG: ATP-dependent RNA helicase HrpA, partial [Vibrionaceae bacterium]